MCIISSRTDDQLSNGLFLGLSVSRKSLWPPRDSWPTRVELWRENPIDKYGWAWAARSDQSVCLSVCQRSVPAGCRRVRFQRANGKAMSSWRAGAGKRRAVTCCDEASPPPSAACAGWWYGADNGHRLGSPMKWVAKIFIFAFYRTLLIVKYICKTKT